VPDGPGIAYKALQDIGNDCKRIRGERVTLPMAILAADLVLGDTIEEDQRMTRVKDMTRASTPFVVEPLGFENGEQTTLVHRVEGFRASPAAQPILDPNRVRFGHLHRPAGRFWLVSSPFDRLGQGMPQRPDAFWLARTFSIFFNIL
jgi:hypothetical protein